jgi:hypothetical protein
MSVHSIVATRESILSGGGCGSAGNKIITPHGVSCLPHYVLCTGMMQPPHLFAASLERRGILGTYD